MASMKMSGCMKLVSRMSQADQDLLLARLDQYQADGVPAERAQFMAAQDTLAEVQGERTQLASLLREQHPDLFVVTGGAKLSRTRAEQAENEYTRVYEKYVGTPEWMKAPNGKPTKLTERQWIQVRTPQFKEWFGDWEKHARAENPVGSLWSDDNVSKVVDDNGEPLVVYHGTDKGGFSEFNEPGGRGRGDLGIFATPNRAMALTYVKRGRGAEIVFDNMDREPINTDEVGDQPGYYASFMNIRNPQEDDFEGALWNGQLEEPRYEMYGADGEPTGEVVNSREEADRLVDEGKAEGGYMTTHDIGRTTDSVVAEARGYSDGVIIRNVIDDGGGYSSYAGEPTDVFVAFKPNQLKSATQNTGEFGTDTNDMRFSKQRTDTPEFKRWSKNLPLVEADYSGSYNGGPAVFEAFHGTTHDDITEFQVVGNKEGALGAGPYMSTSVDDVNENYAGVGPDLTNRIGREEDNVRDSFYDDPWFATQVLEDYFAAEGIEQEVTDDNFDGLKDEYGDAAISHAATARLKGKSDGLVMPVYVRMEKPFNMATNPTYFELTYPVDENGEPDYEAEPEGSAVDLINAINEVASWYNADADSLTSWVYENATDGVSAREVFDRAAKDMSEIYDDNGEMISSGQFIQEVAREMGFDGLIQDADLYFGTQRRGLGGIRAGAMKGVQPGTLHLMPFDGAQVKSATGNNGDYSDSRDITKSTRRTDTPEFKRWAETNGSVIKDANGQPLVLYRGGVGDKELSENFLNAEPRPGYATFASSSPFVANSYANPEAAFNSEVGAVAPLYVKAKRLIEFTVGRRFDKFEFDRRARTLQPGEVLVARQVYDYGPRASSTVDPEKLYSYPSDIFAWRSAAVKSATGNSGAFSDDNSDTRFSKQRIVGESSRKYTPEQLAMFKNTGRTVEVPTIKERIASLRKDFGKKMAQGLADQFRPLKDLSKEAYALARLSKGAAGAFEAFLHHGKLKITDNVYDAENTGGFIERLGVPLHGELEDFMWWTAANRAKRLKAEGRENLFSDADIQAGLSLDQGTTDYDYTIQNGPEKGKVTRDRTKIFRDAQVIFNEFNKNALDMAEQSGLIDGESRKLWENEFYIPFYRVSEEDGGFIGAKIGQPLVRQRAFKMLKGGTDKLNSDLLANTLQNWGHLIDAAAKNRAAKASLEAAANVGVAIESNETTVRQLGKALAMRKNVVWFMDQGKERYFLVEDPHVLAAITSLEFAGMRGPLMDALSKFKHYLTIGVTASPAFKIRNLIRDSLQAVATAPLSYNVAGNLKEGFKATDRKGQDYVSMLASGALIRFGTMEGSRADQTRRLIKQGVKDSTILDSESKVKAFYDKYLEPGIAAYQELGNRGEEINRAALYKQLIKQGKSHQEASLMARDLMDFSMQGTFTSVRFLTQVVPFMNARIQGLYKLGRATKEDQARMAMVIGATALASIALMAAYADDDDWKKREDWDRNNNWWFKFGGVAFRIPKPFEIGAVATMAERGLEYFTSKEMTGKRLGQNYWHILMDNLSMNPVPQAVKPIIDVYSNKDSFSGRPIETMGMEKLKSQYRYTQNTSMVARGLSTATFGALSPVQFDHVMRGYFGWLGSFVVSGADYAIRPLTNEATRPQGDYWKMATAGIVSETGGASSRYVSQMYDQAKVLEEAYGTYRSLLKEGKTAEAKEFFQANKEDLTKYRSVERVKQAEAKFNERIRMIERSAMDPAVKKEKIREIQVQKDRVARLVAPGLR